MKISKYTTCGTMILVVCCALTIAGCKSFIEVDPPLTSSNASIIFNTDATAAAVLTGVYSNLVGEESGTTGVGAVNLAPSLSSDEIVPIDNAQLEFRNYYRNNIDPALLGDLPTIWGSFYGKIFTVNSAIEGLNKAEKLTLSVKQQLLGEAYFMRAFLYFYLVNLFGDVPLVVTTDYKVNAAMPRTKIDLVYNQMKEDLLKAQSMLSEDYLDGTLLKPTSERVRPNKNVASALLARVYLYISDWQNAETQASQIITNTSTFKIEALARVFLKESKESIWALQPTGSGVFANTGFGRRYVLPSSGPSNEFFLYLNDDLVKSFDNLDLRGADWIARVTALGVTYSYANKYKIGSVQSATLEYPIVFRLAEQYLIRAEARAQQNKLIGINSAQSDIDVIRSRAGLGGTTATTQVGLLRAILTERRHELFAEWGHRWLDLRRTGTIDVVMTPATAGKGGTWSSDDALYPIPVRELQNNPKLVQNKGYK
jgi:hypothetical protein